MKPIYSFVLASLLALGPSLAWGAPTQGLLTSVSGQVQVKSASGAKTREAQKGTTVSEGERIITDKASKATLQLFDGSELAISPGTDFTLDKLQQPSKTDKIIGFKLFVGKLLAKVKKLASAKSSFEIEAGGVVCGVRGTQFSMDYHPGQNTLDLNVLEGSVYANSNGNTNVFNAGQQVEFLNGEPQGKPNGGSNPPPNKGQGANNNPALGDLNHQFTGGLQVNGDNTLNDPGVEGSVRVNVHVGVSGN